jgi:hypothetical protein
MKSPIAGDKLRENRDEAVSDIVTYGSSSYNLTAGSNKQSTLSL